MCVCVFIHRKLFNILLPICFDSFTIFCCFVLLLNSSFIIFHRHSLSIHTHVQAFRCICPLFGMKINLNFVELFLCLWQTRNLLAIRKRLWRTQSVILKKGIKENFFNFKCVAHFYDFYALPTTCLCVCALNEWTSLKFIFGLVAHYYNRCMKNFECLPL